MPTAPIWQATPGHASQGPGAPTPGAPGPGAPGPGAAGQAAPGQAGYGPSAMPGGVQPMGPAAGASRGADSRGFLSALFDFSFSSFVTTRIIKVLYVLIMVLVSLVALFYTIIAFRLSTGFGLLVLIIGDPLYIIIVMAFWRLLLEAFVVVFRIAEDVRAIRERTGHDRRSPGLSECHETPVPVRSNAMEVQFHGIHQRAAHARDQGLLPQI
jgi:hypothetical protein